LVVGRPAQRAWRVVETIGGPGTGVGQFQSPGGIAVDRLGNLYVADSYNHRVQRITPAGEVAVIGVRGERPGCFLNPQGVTVDEQLRFYVVEQGGRRVQAFSRRGELLGGWRGYRELLAPTAIASGPQNALFVADVGRGCVFVLSAADAWSGVTQRRVTVAELRHPRLSRPQGVCVDATGDLFVADTAANLVLRFSALGGRWLPGEFAASWSLAAFHDGSRWRAEPVDPDHAVNTQLSTVSRLSEPQDLAVDERGCLFVAERGGDRLSIFDAGGTLAQQVASVGTAGALAAPCGVAVTLDGSLYLADTGNHRILRLRADEAHGC
jgi:DNA-binding beta-propeller fold protein YncE